MNYNQYTTSGVAAAGNASGAQQISYPATAAYGGQMYQQQQMNAAAYFPNGAAQSAVSGYMNPAGYPYMTPEMAAAMQQQYGRGQQQGFVAPVLPPSNMYPGQYVRPPYPNAQTAAQGNYAYQYQLQAAQAQAAHAAQQQYLLAQQQQFTNVAGRTGAQTSYAASGTTASHAAQMNPVDTQAMSNMYPQHTYAQHQQPPAQTQQQTSHTQSNIPTSSESASTGASPRYDTPPATAPATTDESQSATPTQSASKQPRKGIVIKDAATNEVVDIKTSKSAGSDSSKSSSITVGDADDKDAVTENGATTANITDIQTENILSTETKESLSSDQKDTENKNVPSSSWNNFSAIKEFIPSNPQDADSNIVSKESKPEDVPQKPTLQNKVSISDQEEIQSPVITTTVVPNSQPGSATTKEMTVYTFDIPSTVPVELKLGEVEDTKNFKADVILKSPANEETPTAPASSNRIDKKRSEAKKQNSDKSPDQNKLAPDHSIQNAKVPESQSTPPVNTTKADSVNQDDITQAKPDAKKLDPAPEKKDNKEKSSQQSAKTKRVKPGKKRGANEKQTASVLDAYLDTEKESRSADSSLAEDSSEASRGTADVAEAAAAAQPAVNEDDLSWEDKTIPDDKPEDESTQVEDDNSQDGDDSQARKTYDRDFLLSCQRAPFSVKKGTFYKEQEFGEILLPQPNFLNPLPQKDTRAEHHEGGGGGGGGYNDFTPNWMRGKQQPSLDKRQWQTGGGGGQLNRQSWDDRNRRQNQQQQQKTFHTGASLRQAAMPNAAEHAWQSKRKTDTSSLPEEQKKTEEIKRSTRYILNRLTPQNFQDLSKEMAVLDIDTDERVEDVIQLIFDKACLEPGFAEAYANICRTVLQIRTKKFVPDTTITQQSEITDPVVKGFRRALLTKCQKEFQKEKDYNNNYEETKNKILADTSLSDKERREKNEEAELTMKMSKKKYLGNVRFIGELFKLSFLTEKIMHDCIVVLLKAKDEDSLECLCKLLTTIGAKLDHEKARNFMDQYFTRMKHMMADTKNVSSRIRFMLQDVVELREAKWESKKDTNPKTIDQIHREARKEDDRIRIEAEIIKQESRDRSFNNHNRKYSMPNRQINNNLPQSEWQQQTVPHSNRNNISQTEVRNLLKSTTIPVVGLNTDLKLGGGSSSRTSWAKGSGSGGGGGAAGGGGANSGGAKRQDSGGSAVNRFGALSAFDDPAAADAAPRSSSLDHRMGPMQQRGPSAAQKQQSRDDALKAVRQASSGGSGSRDRSATTGSHAYDRSTSVGNVSAASDANNAQSGAHSGAMSSAAPLTSDQITNKVNCFILELIDSGAREDNLKEYCEIIQAEVPLASHSDFIKGLVEYSIDKSRDICNTAAKLLYEVLKSGTLSTENFQLGLESTLTNAVDLAYDVPMIWSNYGILLAQLIRDQFGFDKLALVARKLIDEDKAKDFMAEIALYASQIMGEKIVAEMWCLSKVSWNDLIPEYVDKSQLSDFISTKELEFTMSTQSNISLDSAENSILELLTSNKHISEITNFIDEHLKAFIGSNEFTRMLVRNVLKASICVDTNPVSFDPKKLESKADLLIKYIDNKEESMFQALYSVQLLLHDFQHPPGLHYELFKNLIDQDVVTDTSVISWSKNNDSDYATGKGVCVMNLKSLISYLEESANTSESDDQ